MEAGNSYTITFPSVKIAGGRSLQMTLLLDLTQPGISGLHYFMSNLSLNLHLRQIGKLKYSWDDDDYFILASEMKVDLFDGDGILEPILFSRAYASCKAIIVISDAGSTILEINNDLQKSGIESGVDHYLGCTFESNSKVLNDSPVAINNVFNDLFAGKYGVDTPRYYPLTEVLNDFVSIVNPDQTTEIRNNWTFISSIYNGNTYSCTIDALKVRFRSIFRKETASGWVWVAENYMQALKQLLLSLGMFGGFTDSKTALFTDFWDHLNTGDVQFISNNMVIDHSQVCDRDNYQFVELLTGSYSWGNVGDKSTITELNKSIPILGDLFAIEAAGTEINLGRISSDGGTTSQFWTDFLLNVYSRYYLSNYYTRTFTLELGGTDYSMHHKYAFNGLLMVPKSMEIDYVGYRTSITFIVIGTVT